MPSNPKIVLIGLSIMVFCFAALGQTTSVQGFHRTVQNDPFATESDANDLSVRSAPAAVAGIDGAKVTVGLDCGQMMPDNIFAFFAIVVNDKMPIALRVSVLLSGARLNIHTAPAEHHHQDSIDFGNDVVMPGSDDTLPAVNSINVRYRFDSRPPQAALTNNADSHALTFNVTPQEAVSAGKLLIRFPTNGDTVTLSVDLHNRAATKLIETCANAAKAQPATSSATQPVGIPRSALDSSLFMRAASVPVGTAPGSIAVADFHRSHRIDAAVVNAGSNTVSILQGNGAGSFRVSQTLEAGRFPDTVAIGDFNHDGYPDLVISNYFGPSARIFLNNGDGIFRTGADIQADNNTTAVVVADLNRDGDADLALISRTAGTVTTMLGLGDGTFRTGTTSILEGAPFLATTADLNHDGIPDLIVAKEQTGEVSVLLGLGDGSFQRPRSFPVGRGPVQPVIGDFNGDGKPDIAVVNGGSGDVSVLLGNGDGTFRPQKTYAVGAISRGLASVDVDGDGILDLVVTSQSENSLSILYGRGDGTFLPRKTFPTSRAPVQPVAARLVSTGGMDVLVSASDAGVVDVLLGKP